MNKDLKEQQYWRRRKILEKDVQFLLSIKRVDERLMEAKRRDWNISYRIIEISDMPNSILLGFYIDKTIDGHLLSAKLGNKRLK